MKSTPHTHQYCNTRPSYGYWRILGPATGSGSPSSAHCKPQPLGLGSGLTVSLDWWEELTGFVDRRTKDMELFTNPVHRLRKYSSASHNFSTTNADNQLPLISPQTAALLSVAFTLLYVLPFYLSPSTRPSPTLNRDAPSVIRARIHAVTLACIIASVATLALIIHTTGHTPLESLHLLGWYPIHDPSSSLLAPLLLTLTLFAGPLFERLLIERIDPSTAPATLLSWIGYRNFVAGPITEEVLFRSVLVPIHLLARISPTTTTFVTPLYFGIAHLHHLYEFTLTHPHTPWLPILLRSLFQFTYTTLFGWFAAFVYLRSASLYTVILIHTFCNWIGFPRFWGRVRRTESFFSAAPSSVPATRLQQQQDDPMTDPATAWTPHGDLHPLWTVTYYALLLAGAYGFYRGFWPLTASRNALADFS